jgi:CelD/BcsL family acetyltransferase involved in cellulose biosynthesis
MEIKLLNETNTEQWNQLMNVSATGTFFQTPRWIKLWQKHFASQNLIKGIFDEDVLIGVAPFVEHDGILQFAAVAPVLGSEMVSDYGDLVVSPGREKEVWEEVIKALGNRKQATGKMELNFVREDSPSLEILKSLGGSVEEVDVAPHLCLPKSWDEYLTSLGRHDRHELRRKMRKVEAEGITFSQHTQADSFDMFLALMAASSEDKKKFLSEDMKKYFHDIYNTYFPTGMLRIYYLKKEERAIAAVLLFVWKGEMLLYNSGFNPEFGYIAPGLVLNGYVIKRAIEEELKCYDFLRGNERYKYDIGGKDRRLYKIIIEAK